MAQTPRSNLPHAEEKTFETLDSYLAHLKVRGAYDVPFYIEVEPGRYRLESGRGSHLNPPQFFTREELMRKYGFSH